MRILDIAQITGLFGQLANNEELSSLVDLSEVREDQRTLLEQITLMMPHTVIAESLGLIHELLQEVSQVDAQYVTSEALPEDTAKKELKLEEKLRGSKGLRSIVTGEITPYPQITAGQIGDSLVKLAKSTRVN